MQMLVAMTAVHDLAIHALRSKAQHSCLLMIDPHDRVMKLIHFSDPDRRYITA